MPHRDDLEAALARAEAAERRVRELQGAKARPPLLAAAAGAPDVHRVLIIDANASDVLMMRSVMASLGVDAESVAFSGDVLETIRRWRPSLVVLCAELPTGSGYSICNKLKKDPELKDLPLLLTSAEATPDVFEQHKRLKTHADEYLIKPFSTADLALKTLQLIGSAPPADREPRPGAQPGLARVDQYNRSRLGARSSERSRPAGVACPRCAELGELVEMVEGEITLSVDEVHARQVVCPRCLWSDYKAE